MANISEYIDKFFGLGSKASVNQFKRDLLERLISYEEQDLTTEQRIQVFENIGIKVGKIDLTKGAHDIYFTNEFTQDYMVSANGSTGTMTVNTIIIDDSHYDYFTIKVTADCTVRWTAKILTEIT